MGFFKKRAERLAAEREAQKNREEVGRIRVQAKEQADQLLKIVNDCAHLVNTTVNPEVFFQRYSLMLEKLEELARLEWTGIFSKSPELPSATVLRLDDLFPVATNDFIDRSHSAAMAKAENLKTEKGKAGAMARYFENMEKFSAYMSEDSIDHLNTLKEKKQLTEGSF